MILEKKLKESIPSNSVKIIELYNKINSEILNTSPHFQRKLVWKKQHKFHFIETILLNFPFPEIYIASGDMDLENLTTTEIVVDGQQRLTTIVDYIKGINDFELQSKVTPFSKLTKDAQRDFLNYLVTVKDLKCIDMDSIKEIFSRINSTEYSLNTIEKNNAEYGDGEFVIFCKQLIEKEYTVTDNDTDIILQHHQRSVISDFFEKNKIFSKNDIARMYNIQYIMLIVSTIVEGNYFGRGTIVNQHLEKYNDSFSEYEIALEEMTNSVNILNLISFEKNSYWLNQANLFTLLIELAKINKEELVLPEFESKLLELQGKAAAYFAETDSDTTNLTEITKDEGRYFEQSRQGSHEKSAREHRGNIIRSIIKSCIIKLEKPSLKNTNCAFLDESSIVYTLIAPTKTGLSKGIMDATLPIRTFLKDNSIHDYDMQDNGPDHKVKKDAYYIDSNIDSKKISTKISLYKATHRGDPRIWISDLNKYTSPNELIAIIYINNNIYIVNLDKESDISGVIKKM